MDKTPFISNQRDLLQAMAKGGLLYSSRDAKNGKQQWWLIRQKSYQVRVLISTGDAAQRKGHIEPTGLLYWKITDAGQAHLAHMNQRIGKGKKLPKEYTR